MLNVIFWFLVWLVDRWLFDFYIFVVILIFVVMVVVMGIEGYLFMVVVGMWGIGFWEFLFFVM